ncbi:hypothetical protein GOP47_0007407 [Adiantum capillus-veneris]|uniref:Uncharacterized protein n=1 Tax=Adiantum capillus-veneris TaxID=13818 RepID=A0A9D4V1H9_ADICA|nr:hypothetical protein GOP47_0007407 [Adiantum capillus-veneris]
MPKERSPKVEKKEAWEAILTKGLGLSQLESTIKRLDIGYIASIFSANYRATALRRAPLRTKIDMDDLLLPVTDDSDPKKFSNFALAYGRARRSSLSDMTFMQPLLNNDDKEPSTGENGGGGREADGNRASRKVESLSGMHPEAVPLVDPLITSNQATAPYSVCVLKRAISFPRAKYLTFMDNTEDGDTLSDAGKSSASVLEENVCLVRDNAIEEPNLQKLLTATHCGGVPVESRGVNTCTHIFDELELPDVPLWEATLDTGIHPWCRTPSENPRNLQKTLSMKYILNDNTIENEELHTLTDNYAPSPELSMLHRRSCDEDDDEFKFLYESNTSSCVSSPEFSSAASLKDWLPPEDPPLMLAVDFYQAGKETYKFDAFQASRMFLQPDLPRTKRVLLKYVGGDSGHPLIDDGAEDILQSPSHAEKGARSRIDIDGHY